MPLGRYRRRPREEGVSPTTTAASPTSSSAEKINEETTVMVRNIPTRFTSITLIDVLKEHGFDKTFDFIYSPIDFRTKKNVGYAFINFVNPEYKEKFASTFQGLQLKATTSKKALDIISSRRQGFLENIGVFGASELLASSHHLPHYKPLVMVNGELVPLTEELYNSFFASGQEIKSPPTPAPGLQEAV